MIVPKFTINLHALLRILDDSIVTTHTPTLENKVRIDC